ncbi:Na+/H+ antiporter subunit E [Sphingomonas sp. IC-11]|uniref:Na+/H+ antiporter subunit E n=1 Tax=Sphingomonas sp. IC-11 TaxID=2898528 RepID=UPI001E2F4F1F|nr:Na+/H+ antiporter subunit E [Sphingomonas sp. IC-11]MCD2315281.1 Na+/H+ antiporter subunit E [Sphingomonas sp. IC-11]
MRRWFPHPLITGGLFVMWLLLTQSFSPGQILLGAAVAVLGGGVMNALRPQRHRVARLRVIVALACAVLADVLRSNFAVAAIVVARRRPYTSGFMSVPIALTNRHALAVLAIIITATPGTMWVEFDRRQGMLLIHVLDLVDEERWVRVIKQRYEARLIEIFGE